VGAGVAVQMIGGNCGGEQFVSATEFILVAEADVQLG
jgi:hypothetical protein